jgi:hypothetical protein
MKEEIIDIAVRMSEKWNPYPYSLCPANFLTSTALLIHFLDPDPQQQR